MWLTDLLRKLTRGPDVGETFRDYIGCYLYGIEAGEQPQPEYLGAPASLEQLEREVRRYLEDFLSTQQQPDSAAVQAVQSVLHDLPARLRAHVATDMQQPFLRIDGTAMFIRKGVRQRRKENGRFVE